MSYKGAIVLSAYSRISLFEKCLKSIYSATNSEKYKKILIVQNGNSEISKIAHKYFDQKTSIISLDGENRSALENICFNYWVALNTAFEINKCDWVLEIEDDTEIASDTFIFIENIMDNYFNNLKFRGINLGSTNDDIKYNNSYSLLRNSFHASQGVLTRHSWERINARRIRRQIGKFPLDWCVEPYWRTGFVVTPNVSRCMNYGWIGGTHVSNDPQQDLFVGLQNSWNSHRPQENFHLVNINHNWNGNITPYNGEEDFKYFLKYIYSYISNNARFIKMYKKARNVKRTLLRRPNV